MTNMPGGVSGATSAAQLRDAKGVAPAALRDGGGAAQPFVLPGWSAEQALGPGDVGEATDRMEAEGLSDATLQRLDGLPVSVHTVVDVAVEVAADDSLAQVERALRQFDSQQCTTVTVLEEAQDAQDAAFDALPAGRREPAAGAGLPFPASSPTLGRLMQLAAADALPREAVVESGVRPQRDMLKASAPPEAMPMMAAVEMPSMAAGGDALKAVPSGAGLRPVVGMEAVMESGVRQDAVMLRAPAPPLDMPTVAAAVDSSRTAAGAEVSRAERLVQTADARWGEQFVRALHDQIQVQLRQGSQVATMRLDPPELGQLDIRVVHEQGRLQVQIHAAQPDVARMLNQIGDRLRSDLLAQQFEQVDLRFGSDSGQGREDRRRDGSAASDRILSNERADELGDDGQRARDDVLISV